MWVAEQQGLKLTLCFFTGISGRSVKGHVGIGKKKKKELCFFCNPDEKSIFKLLVWLM